MSIDKVTPQEWDRLGQIKKANHDPVNRPSHYNQGKFECIEYINFRALFRKLDFLNSPNLCQIKSTAHGLARTEF